MDPRMCLMMQVEDPALRDPLGRAASQLYTALGDRLPGAEPEAEVVRSLPRGFWPPSSQVQKPFAVR